MKYIIAMTGIVLLFSSSLSAQIKKNVIKTSLVFPLGNVFELSYERVINADKSFQISGFVGGGIDAAIMPEFRLYLSEGREAPDGVFVAPFAMVATDIGGGGVMVGVQKLFKQKISLEACLGPFITTDGVAVMGGLNLGFAF